MSLDKTGRLLGFLTDSVDYFARKVEGIDRDRYFADRDIRSILDKTINDLILCIVDISEECMKRKGRSIPATYRDTILACHEFLGDVVLTMAPLVRHRNELVHEYLKVNWQNIVTVRRRIPDILTFAESVRAWMSQDA